MERSRSVARSWVPVVVAFLIGATFVGGAWAAATKIEGNLRVTGVVKAKDFRYANPKMNVLAVPGSAFFGDSESDDWSHDGYSGAVICDTSCTVVAPVNLPQGAVVKKVVWFHETTSSDADLHLEANSRASVGTHADIVDMDPVGCASLPCSTTQAAGPGRRINNLTRHYGLYLSGNAGHTTFAVLIYYKTGAVGPAAAAPTAAATLGADHAHD